MVFLDITKRKAAENKAHWQEMQQRRILDAMPDLICLCDRDMCILWANNALLKMTGRPLQEVVGDFCYRLLYDRDIPCDECHTVKAFKNNAVQPFAPAMPPLGAEGADAYWESCCIPLADPSDHMMHFLHLIRDVSELKRSMNRIRWLSGQLLNTQERERHKIARELHDGVAQDLAAYRMICREILETAEDLPARVVDSISEMTGSMEKSIRAVRELAYDLRPPGFEPEEITDSIHALCKEAGEASGLDISFWSAGMDDLTLGGDTRIGLYRLVQEGIRNILKHAHASRAHIGITAAFPNVMLSIRDNGGGFNVKERERAASKEKRMGLRSMEERVQILGGSFFLNSNPGEGTSLRILLPQKEV